MEAPALVHHSKCSKNTITSIAFNNNDNETFAFSSLDKTVNIFSFMKKKPRKLTFNYDHEIFEVGFSSKNILGAVGKSKIATFNEAVLLNGFNEKIVAHQSDIRSIHFSSSGNRFITAGNDKCIKMFRLGQKNFIGSFTGHTNWIRCARFSPTNKLIATCSDDKTTKIFDVNTGKLVHSFDDEKGYGKQLCWHPDSNTIAIAQENGRVKIYDVANRKLIQYYRIFESSVNCLDFHASGHFMVTGDDNNYIKILDLLEGRDIFTIKGHSGPITAVKFSGDGNYFVSGSADCSLMVFKSNLSSQPLSSSSEESASGENKENSRDEGVVDVRNSVYYNYSNNDDEIDV